ncbi:MAG TPA: HD domain-containing protein [Geothermobacteraceae bacterium]|nr:HD domain-containing protein [Geothermobacteraceae bacterium]
MKKTFVAEIRERDQVESPFLVRDKITAMAKNGKPYLTLKLMDKSGELEGRVWDRVDELAARFERDDFVLVRGKASSYLGKMQLVVQELEKLDDQLVSLGDFLPVAAEPPELLLMRFKEVLGTLHNPHLAQLMQLFATDEGFVQKYSSAPAAKSMHHVYLGGLLEHSLAIAALVDDVSARYPELDRDLLVVGALLHDVGKIEELTYQRSFDYSDEGKLLGHIMLGVEMLEERLRQLPEFPKPLAVHLKHLLLSHHGQYEYGSPKRPKTLEATVLNYLDDLDSKINGIRSHMERDSQGDSAWTSYHRLYDRYFYKGEMPQGEPAPPVDQPSQPAVKKPQPASERRSTRPGFGFTLGDQLAGKNLDLFSAEPDDKES